MLRSFSQLSAQLMLIAGLTLSSQEHEGKPFQKSLRWTLISARSGVKSGRVIQRHGEAQLQGEMDERDFWVLIISRRS